MRPTQPVPKTEDPVAWTSVFDCEVAYLGYEKTQLDTDTEKSAPNLTGICLSGGGVRSAIFCGGVLEYLAKKDLLRKFDYVSTVSGGGYAGASLSYWGHAGDRPEPTMLQSLWQTASQIVPFMSDATGTKAQPISEMDDPFAHHASFVRHLRANISYLMPGGFQDALIGAYVVLRSILINILIWMGLATGLFHLLLNDTSVEADISEGTGFLNAVWAQIEKGAGILGPDIVFLVLSGLGAICLLALLLLFPIFSLGTFFKIESGYLWRKRIEKIAGRLLIVAVIVLPFGLLPAAARNIELINTSVAALSGPASQPVGLGILGTIAGTAISLFGLFRAQMGKVFGSTSRVTIVVGAILLIVSVALLSMHLAQNLSPSHVFIFAGISLILALFCNINDVSLGRFYRDRLMEAFMPDKAAIKEAGEMKQPLAMSGGATALQADRLRLSDLALDPPVAPDQRKMPAIHLVNTNVLSWWAPDTRAQRRKGDNFVLSPLYCGSDMTRWKKTGTVARNRLTLATAMAVSGAAVNPQAGFAGQGPTTSWPVAIAMAFLSLRLGYWLHWKKNINVSKFGNHIYPGLTQLMKRLISSEVRGTVSNNSLGKPHESAPNYLELSDGGHFDNLGLYELIRRGCRIMVVCDGGHDPRYSYDAFSVLTRRVAEDFGATIKFDVHFDKAWPHRKGMEDKPEKAKSGPQDLVARKVENEYPSGTDYAEKGYFLASVTYEGSPQEPGQDGYRACRPVTRGKDAPHKGLIIYLKSTLIRELELTTKGYKGSNPLFPSDPTSNQFFSPEQFEAYRDVGQKIAAQMDRELRLDNLIEQLTKKTGNDLSKIDARFDGKNQFAKPEEDASAKPDASKGDDRILTKVH